MIGRTINQYRITARLGAGGMGEVYLATDTKLDRQVALKFLSQQFSSDPDARARFQREAKALAALNHPNIVAVYDVSEHEGRPYIVMEYLEGESIKELIADGDVGINRAIEIISQISEGLAAAHEAKIVHRDIKSDNIIVTPSGRVKIMDFGLATWRGVTKITQEGSTVGTMAYMSPEQAQGDAVDHRADLWSLGVVLYELVSGRMPFAGDHHAAVTYAITNEAPEPLARYRANLPGRLQETINRLLEKDPGRRYQSAADLTADLKRIGTTLPLVRRRSPRRMILRLTLGIGAVVVLANVAYRTFAPYHEAADNTVAPDRIMLAVLPFVNLGSDDQEYFADGITEAITSRLAGIHELGVISRTSAITYKKTKKGLKEIGQELGVDYVLEGTIQWDRSGDTDRVLITPQLIRVEDDTHLWSSRYERPLTQVFALQAEIAEKVADALDVTLLERDRESIQAIPTEHLGAYDLYLRADDYFQRDYSIKNFEIAQKLLEEAIALDGNFATAYALLSLVQASQYWFSGDSPVEHIESAKVSADRALQLDPDLPAGHLALGLYYYWAHRDYEHALDEFEIARSALPVEATEYIAAINRRQGHWGQALENNKLVAELNPRDANIAFEYAITLRVTRRFEQSEFWFQRAAALAPDNAMAHTHRAALHIAWRGDLQRVREIITEASAGLPKMAIDFLLAGYLELTGNYVEARRHATLDGALSMMNGDTSQYYLFHANLYRYEGQRALMNAYADTAREIAERYVANNSNYARFHTVLGQTYALLRRKDEAIREGRRATELLPLSKDALEGAFLLESLARIYANVGEHDLSIDLLEQLLSIPSWTTVHTLRLQPTWNPLREFPRFQKLLKQKEKVF